MCWSPTNTRMKGRNTGLEPEPTNVCNPNRLPREQWISTPELHQVTLLTEAKQSVQCGPDPDPDPDPCFVLEAVGPARHRNK